MKTHKFCPECGAKIAEGSKFCRECGNKLPAQIEIKEHIKKAETKTQEEPPKKKPKETIKKTESKTQEEKKGVSVLKSNKSMKSKKIGRQSFTQRIRGIIIRPSKTFEEIVENKALNQAIGIFIIAEVIDYYIDSGGFHSGLVGWLLGSLLLWGIGTVLFKGKGGYSDMLTVTGFAHLPLIIFLIIYVPLFALIDYGIDYVGTNPIMLVSVLLMLAGAGVLIMVIIIWQIALTIIGVKAALRFDSYKKAILTLIVNFIFAVSFVAFFFLLHNL